MKKMIIILCLLATTVLADGKYLFLWLEDSAPAQDKQAIRTKIYQRLKDNVEIDPADLPRWRLAANTNRTGRLLCIDITGKKLDLTKAEAEAWCQANLSQPNKLHWVTGDGPNVPYDNGLEPVPIEGME